MMVSLLLKSLVSELQAAAVLGDDPDDSIWGAAGELGQEGDLLHAADSAGADALPCRSAGAAGQQCGGTSPRGVEVGRKNHYGSHSKRGAEVAAICNTLFESTKLAGVDPYRYVLEATRRAIASPATATLPEQVT